MPNLAECYKQFFPLESNRKAVFLVRYVMKMCPAYLHFFYKNNFIRTQGSFLLKI